LDGDEVAVDVDDVTDDDDEEDVEEDVTGAEMSFSTRKRWPHSDPIASMS